MLDLLVDVQDMFGKTAILLPKAIMLLAQFPAHHIHHIHRHIRRIRRTRRSRFPPLPPIASTRFQVHRPGG